jgi:hypothetical protein
MADVKHGIRIDWAYEHVSCDCGWGPKERPIDVPDDESEQLEAHLREVWIMEASEAIAGAVRKAIALAAQ